MRYLLPCIALLVPTCALADVAYVCETDYYVHCDTSSGKCARPDFVVPKYPRYRIIPGRSLTVYYNSGDPGRTTPITEQPNWYRSGKNKHGMVLFGLGNVGITPIAQAPSAMFFVPYGPPGARVNFTYGSLNPDGRITTETGTCVTESIVAEPGASASAPAPTTSAAAPTPAPAPTVTASAPATSASTIQPYAPQAGPLTLMNCSGSGVTVRTFNANDTAMGIPFETRSIGNSAMSGLTCATGSCKLVIDGTSVKTAALSGHQVYVRGGIRPTNQNAMKAGCSVY